MNNIVIACQVLKDELNLVMKETGCTYPVIWVDSDYHINPDKLREKLQEEINALSEVDNILFAYGCCGNGLVGLKATTANLIIPKIEDCISLLLSQPDQEPQRVKETYFLTQGWLDSSRNIVSEYSYSLKRYGAQRTQKIYALLLKYYRYLAFIDTGAYNVQESMEKAHQFAQAVNLQLDVIQGSTWLLKKLLTGPHDANFCLVKKGDTVQLSCFGSAAGRGQQQMV